MRPRFSRVAALLLAASVAFLTAHLVERRAVAKAQQISTAPLKPIRVAAARLAPGHVSRVWQPQHPDVEIVGIYEPNAQLVESSAKQFGFDRRLVYTDLAKMLDESKPDALVAFGSIYEHLAAVEAAAPRGVHVMVEKPLAVSVEHALRIQALAKRYGIHVLTNYETTRYPRLAAAHQLVEGDSVIGPLRKLVAHDGNRGPKEIGVGPQFLEWLTDPVQNGGGALFDFGCYGANLATWYMNGEAPITVTAVTQQIKPDVYPRVDDEATIVLTYPHAQAILQASWHWPFSRKDMEVYGQRGYAITVGRDAVRVRLPEKQEISADAKPLEKTKEDSVSYLRAVLMGGLKPEGQSSLDTNVIVTEILDAARQSAATGKTVSLAGTR